MAKAALKQVELGQAKAQAEAPKMAEPPLKPAARRAAARASEARASALGPGLADRRQRILKVAAVRFAETGFAATTVRQIADDVNILSGSLYHHFATKEDMLHEILTDPVRRMSARAKRIAALPVDAEVRLVMMILADVAAHAREHEVHAILLSERWFFRRNPDFLYVVEAKHEAYDGWRTVLADGMRDGLFAAGLDPYMTISTILRMLDTGANWLIHEDAEMLASGNYSFDSLAHYYIGFVLRAIRPPERAGLPIPTPAPLPDD